MKILYNSIVVGIAGIVSTNKINCNSKENAEAFKDLGKLDTRKEWKYNINKPTQQIYSEYEQNRIYGLVKNRESHLNQMSLNKEYDIIVLGGNDIAAACLLEGASRGLRCALISEGDFYSRSNRISHPITQLTNSYIPYIAKQICKLYYGVNSDPYLCNEFKIVLPCTNLKRTISHFYKVALYAILSKLYFYKFAYDIKLDLPRFISKTEMKKLFPEKADCFGFMLTDVQALQNRRLIHTIMTATINKYYAGFCGANICNHLKITNIYTNKENAIKEIEFTDKITNQKFTINGKIIINCDDVHPNIDIIGSNFISIYFTPSLCLFDKCFTKSKDNSNILYYDSTIASQYSDKSKVLTHLKGFKITNTEGGATIYIDSMGDYRKSGEDIITVAISMLSNVSISYAKSITAYIKLYGSYTSESNSSDRFQSKVFAPVYQSYLQNKYNLPADVCAHLVAFYGTKSINVANLGLEMALNEKLSDKLPFLKSEVIYAIRYEMALTLKDIIFRRFELDFSNKCLGNDKIVEKIADIMQSELKWSDELKQNEVSELKKELQM